MSDSEAYIQGKPTTVKTNRGQPITFIPCYSKKEPEGLWEEAYQALKYMGVFDHIGQ